MATKNELAEGLTVEQLRSLAASEDVDLSGLTAKADIVEAVTASVSKDALESAASDTDTTSAEQQKRDEGATTTAASTASTNQGDYEAVDVPAPAVESTDAIDLPPLGPPNPEPQTVENTPAVNRGAVEISDRSPEALQKAGVSPADLELPTAIGGPPIIVKQNPEAPSIHQVAGALTSVPGPVDITVTDGDGNDVGNALGVGDRVQMSQRAQASLVGHPAFTTEGHWSNPNLTEATDEEKEADQEAYASRFG